MNTDRKISRRKFVSGAMTAAVASCLPGTRAFSSGMGNAARASVMSRSNGAAAFADADWKNQGVLNLTKSPHVKLHCVPVRAVTIGDGLWGQRRGVNVSKSIPSMHDLLESNGRMNNFRRLTGKSSAAESGPVYSDSDVYKWTEAVGFALQSGNRPELRATTERMIDDVVAAQEPGGYLNTYYVGDRASQRMLPPTQMTGHELYNMGHMLQGAIAYYRATGDRKMLDAGIRFVDDFLISNYGRAPLKPIVSGHPEIEMALIELYRITGDKRQLDFAGYILGGDDRITVPRQRSIYMFSGTPFTSRTKLEGHAVRAMYACCGATDYYMETGDDSYWNTLNTLWSDLTSTKMYVTGGVGSRAAGEAFGDAYELPNLRAYGESCAAIGNMMWNWRMLAVTGEARFADVIERALYNGINSGMSLDGTLYCYRNPLEYDPSNEGHIRNPWYDTTCCPPNLERIFASLPGYVYSTSKNGMYLHLFLNSQLDWHLENGTGLKITQKTDYPWQGSVQVTVNPAEPSDFTFYLRIPGWSRTAEVTVNGKPAVGAKPGEYLLIHRRWSPGDTIRLQLDMTPQVLAANPRVTDDAGRVAIERGPLIYCLERQDQPGIDSLEDVAVVLGSAPGARFRPETRSDLLGGVVVLRHEGASYAQSEAQVPLFYPYSSTAGRTRPEPLTFIPYYAWANREQTAMEVWTRYIKA